MSLLWSTFTQCKCRTANLQFNKNVSVYSVLYTLTVMCLNPGGYKVSMHTCSTHIGGLIPSDQHSSGAKAEKQWILLLVEFKLQPWTFQYTNHTFKMMYCVLVMSCISSLLKWKLQCVHALSWESDNLEDQCGSTFGAESDGVFLLSVRSNFLLCSRGHMLRNKPYDQATGWVSTVCFEIKSSTKCIHNKGKLWTMFRHAL